MRLAVYAHWFINWYCVMIHFYPHTPAYCCTLLLTSVSLYVITYQCTAVRCYLPAYRCTLSLTNVLLYVVTYQRIAVRCYLPMYCCKLLLTGVSLYVITFQRTAVRCFHYIVVQPWCCEVTMTPYYIMIYLIPNTCTYYTPFWGA